MTRAPHTHACTHITVRTCAAGSLLVNKPARGDIRKARVTVWSEMVSPKDHLASAFSFKICTSKKKLNLLDCNFCHVLSHQPKVRSGHDVPNYPATKPLIGVQSIILGGHTVSKPSLCFIDLFCKRS